MRERASWCLTGITGLLHSRRRSQVRPRQLKAEGGSASRLENRGAVQESRMVVHLVLTTVSDGRSWRRTRGTRMEEFV